MCNSAVPFRPFSVFRFLAKPISLGFYTAVFLCKKDNEKSLQYLLQHIFFILIISNRLCITFHVENIDFEQIFLGLKKAWEETNFTNLRFNSWKKLTVTTNGSAADLADFVNFLYYLRHGLHFGSCANRRWRRLKKTHRRRLFLALRQVEVAKVTIWEKPSKKYISDLCNRLHKYRLTTKFGNPSSYSL